MSGSHPELANLPAGAVLSRVLRLLVPADRRDEFLGDLLEEATARRATSPSALAAWLWSQTLQSAPALLSLRLRRLVPRAQPVSAAAGAGPRFGQRGWPLSLALSLGAHALLIVGTFTWLFSRVDEVQPPQTQLELPRWFPKPPPAPALAQPFESVPTEQPPSRRPRPVRRAVAARASDAAGLATSAPVPASASAPAGEEAAPSRSSSVAPRPGGDRSAAGEALVALPPRVAEKRCLSCPPPQLPPAFARLGAEQETRVKTCVNANGQVTSVDVLTASDPMINARVIDTIRGWHLVPYSVDGRPVPFCYATSFVFASR